MQAYKKDIRLWKERNGDTEKVKWLIFAILGAIVRLGAQVACNFS